MTTATTPTETTMATPTNAYAEYAAKAEPMMASLTFGVEIEIKGMTQTTAAACVRRLLESKGLASARPVQAGHDYYRSQFVEMADGRKWQVMSDASVPGGCEVVTPVLKGWDDLTTLQDVVRALRAAGARVDADCGLHVHVGAQGMDAKGLCRLVKQVYSQEDLIVAGLGIQNRVDGGRWCQRVDERFINNLPRTPSTVNSIGAAYYGTASERDYARTTHYHGARYRGLNLHNLWYLHHGEARGTVEFRYFAGTLHAGRVKTAVQLCLALVARARLTKGAVCRKRTRGSAWTKYDMRILTIRLGLMGEQFATARKFLAENLGGDSRSAGTGRARGGVRREERAARDNGSRA